MLFKDISYLEIGRSFIQQSGPFSAVSVKGIKRNNFVNLL